MEKTGMGEEVPLLLVDSGKGNEAVEVAELKRILRLAGPLVASGFLRNAVQMVSIMFVGHLGALPLAGASLASSLATVTGFSVLFGMADALDTLCGQAFGAGQHHLLGVYKQRAMLVLAVACIPIALVWSYTGEILLLMGQDQDIAAEAGVYAWWLIPSLVPFVPLVCHMSFLQAQCIVMPVVASTAITLLSHVVVCWALVHMAGLGSKGAALANAISYGINMTILALYVRLSSACKKTWTGLSMEAFKELRQFIELAIPSAMMVCLEWWSFELLILLAGLLPNPKLEASVLSICLNIDTLLFMVPNGLCIAISTRVSNELGASQPQAARLATRVVVCMAVTEGLVITLTMILLRNYLGYMYSNEAKVATYIARLIPILAISFFIDGVHASLSGILTGCGKQKIGAIVNLWAFYLAGVPMAILLAFVLHLNGMGLWLGIVCGSLGKLALLLWITVRIDWEKEAIKAKEMVFKSSGPVE